VAACSPRTWGSRSRDHRRDDTWAIIPSLCVNTNSPANMQDAQLNFGLEGAQAAQAEEKGGRFSRGGPWDEDRQRGSVVRRRTL
jgi:hypothetical protein